MQKKLLFIIAVLLTSCASKQKNTAISVNKNYVYKDKMLVGKIPISAITNDTVKFP